MICNTRKPVEIEIEGAKFACRPPTVLQRAELAESLRHDDGNILKAIYRSVECLFNGVVESASGLMDREGREVDFASADKKELAEGLEVDSATAIINAVLEMSALPEAAKKKSSPQAPSGTE